MVVGIERQQEMRAEPFGVVHLECPPQSRAQVPKPVGDVAGRSQIAGWVKGESAFINLLQVTTQPSFETKAETNLERCRKEDQTFYVFHVLSL